MTPYPLTAAAADLLVMIHLLAIVFIVFGGLLVFRWPWAAWFHLPAAVWGVLIEFQGWICPLTPWEQRLRDAAGQGGYEGGFVQHYLLPIIYPEDLTRDLQWILGAAVLMVNVAVYALWLLRKRSRR